MTETVLETGLSHWKTHKLYRQNVEFLVEEFCSWKSLLALLDHVYSERDKAFIATLFLTGGRISEVLQLRKENFEVRKEEGVILVRNMPLLKRYRKLGTKIYEDGHKGWETEKLNMTRKTFPIKIGEPLVPILIDWLNKSEGLLFPSSDKRRKGKPLTRFWAYNTIIRLDRTLPETLKIDLGLNKPFIKNNVKVSDRLHLWLHYFRSQRASQLVTDYGFEILDLINYFSWESFETAGHYAHKGWRGLSSKMESRSTYF